eukprot:scpid81587/ scgid9011/ 
MPADKGQAVVLMDIADYDKKIQDHLNDHSTYSTLLRDPTDQIVDTLHRLLRPMEQAEEISRSQKLFHNPDTRSFTSKLSDALFPTNSRVITADVVSFYTNTNWYNPTVWWKGRVRTCNIGGDDKGTAQWKGRVERCDIGGDEEDPTVDESAIGYQASSVG